MRENQNLELLNRLINTLDFTKKYSLIKQLKEIIQPGQDEFIEPLIQAIRKEKQNLERKKLSECLVKIGTPAAITAIKETAFDLDDFGSKYTINLLEKFTNHEIEVIKAVTEIFQKTDKKETRQRAFLFLEKKANNTLSAYLLMI